MTPRGVGTLKVSPPRAEDLTDMFCLRRPRGERGASIIELALIAPVMGMIVMGTVDLSRGYRMQIQLENAAREGAAFAQIWPNSVDCGSDDDILERVTLEEFGVVDAIDVRVVTYDAFGAEVPVTGCGGTTAGSGDRIRVDVTATFDVLTPMVENVVGGTMELTGSAEVEAQRS